MAHGFAARDKTMTRFIDWTPVLTNMTLGNGTINVSRFHEDSGGLVVCYFEFTLGTTSTVGNVPSISTPVTAAASAVGTLAHGPARLVGGSGATFVPSQVRLISTTNFSPYVFNATGTYATLTFCTATVPFTWTTGDTMAFFATYEAA